MLRDGLRTAEDMIATLFTEHTPSSSLVHDLGKHVGSSLGGSYNNADRLNEW
jgi:hypothetical protein